MRHLASIQEVREITPIQDADAIETVHIQGWTVVCKKGIHFKGEKVVFFEVDSFLPEKEEYELLRASSFKTHPTLGSGFRLRTIKLRKQLSQGLVIPLPEQFKELPIGTDLTEELEIKKWEHPVDASLGGMVKGSFPFCIPKTDQERCLEENTIINTDDGLKTIKEIVDFKFSGNVISYDPQLNKNVWQKIIGWSVMSPQQNEWLKIKTRSGKFIIVTKNHRIYVSSLGVYREARFLKCGDEVKIF